MKIAELEFCRCAIVLPAWAAIRRPPAIQIKAGQKGCLPRHQGTQGGDLIGIVMSRYKGRQSAKSVEQDFPHYVDVVVPNGGDASYLSVR